MSDEILEEVWRIKDEIAKEHGYDIVALGNYYIRKSQERQKRKFSSHPQSVAEQSDSPDFLPLRQS